LPLTWETTNGCTLIKVGTQEYGLFKLAIYDDDDQSFLGCVDYSQALKETFDTDIYFMIGRTAGLLGAMLATIACTLCLFIQCFSKAGKSKLWAIMRWTFVLAFLSQGTVFAILESDICAIFSGGDECTLGFDAYLAAANGLFLFGMVITACCSFPPRNPVFRLWYNIPAEYDTDKADSFEDDADIESAQNSMVDEQDGAESVSLFGGSVKSTRKNKNINPSTPASVQTKTINLDAISENEAKQSDKSVAGSVAKSVKSKASYGMSVSETTFQRRVDAFQDHGVVLGPGGIRRGETRDGNQVIIVDEYPASKMSDGIYPPMDIDGTDMVKVRSEYCRAGRKTIREEYHKDGSRTVTTTITIVGDDSVIAGLAGIDP
jgi:hypothetical protein